jgi:O-antigen/teichoic acid export membrane protein
MLRKSVSFLSFSLISSAIGFLNMSYLTKSISEEDMGVIGLYMAILYIGPQLLAFSSSGLIEINKIDLNKDKYREFTNQHITFVFLTTSILFVLSLILSIFWIKYWLFFFTLPILSCFMYLFSFHLSELVQEGRSKIHGLFTVLNAIFYSIITFFLVEFQHFTWQGRVVGLLIGYAISIFLMRNFSFLTLREFRFNLNIAVIQDFLKFGFPLFVGLGAGWLLNQSDNFIILHFFELKDLGLYSVAYLVGTMINQLNQAMTNSSIPKIYSALANNKGKEIIQKLTFQYTIIILIISVMLGLGSYWYMPLFFGLNYSESYKIVILISLAFAFNGIYRISGSVITYHKKNKLQTILLFVCAATNILISVSIVPFFGIIAPAVGTLCGYLVLCLLSFHFSNKLILEIELKS